MHVIPLFTSLDSLGRLSGRVGPTPQSASERRTTTMHLANHTSFASCRSVGAFGHPRISPLASPPHFTATSRPPPALASTIQPNSHHGSMRYF